MSYLTTHDIITQDDEAALQQRRAAIFIITKYFSRTLQNKNAYLGFMCSKNNIDTLILHLILKKRKTL